MSNSQFFSDCTADSIREAAAALNGGHLVAFPTETVYGLGADARSPEAVKRIYEVKGRPTDHPLIVHISSINQLEKWAKEIPEYAIDLAQAFWPGPMTLILKRTEIAQDFITGGQETVGLRVPSDPIAQALIQEFEKVSDSAVAAPSANRFGHVSATSSDDVLEELGQHLSDGDIVLDGGISMIGIESTIIDCTRTRPRILRPGFVTENDIESITKLDYVDKEDSSLIQFSGSFEKHYAPECKIIIYKSPINGAGFLALKDVETPPNMHRLASPRTTKEFAHDLYATFREADHKGLKFLAVFPPKEEGLGVAILERLKKAAQGR
jgi:L-threonylcarbamoyladenylate synthase